MIATLVLASPAAGNGPHRAGIAATLEAVLRTVPADTCFVVTAAAAPGLPAGVRVIRTAAGAGTEASLVAGLAALPATFRAALVIPGDDAAAALALASIHHAAMLAPDAVIAVKGDDPYPIHLPRWSWPQTPPAAGVRGLLDRDTVWVDPAPSVTA